MVVSTIICFEQNLYFQNFWQTKWFYRGPNEKIAKKFIFFDTKTSKRNLTHFRPPLLPKFFQIFEANFISFHYRYRKSTCLMDYFCEQLLTAGGQKLIFPGFLFEIWPQGKIFATFFASYDQNCGITAWYWKKTFHSLTPSGEL